MILASGSSMRRRREVDFGLIDSRGRIMRACFGKEAIDESAKHNGYIKVRIVTAASNEFCISLYFYDKATTRHAH